MAHNSPTPRFQVDCTQNALAQFRLLAHQWRYRDQGPLLAAAMRKACEQLEERPQEIGEPLYRLRHMKMMVYRSVVPPIYLEYGVHEDHPVVVIRFVAGLSDPVE